MCMEVWLYRGRRSRGVAPVTDGERRSKRDVLSGKERGAEVVWLCRKKTKETLKAPFRYLVMRKASR